MRIEKCENAFGCYACEEMNECAPRRKFLHYGLKQSSSYTYNCDLFFLCRLWQIEPLDVLKMDVDDLGLRFEIIVRGNRATEKISWKRMNVMYNSLKTWLHIHRIIKNRRTFPEIRFPKTRLKVDPLAIQSLETKKHIRPMFSMANGEEDIILGFYGLMALRPSLIPIPRVKHVLDQDLDKEALKRGKLRFKNKPPLLLIPKWTCAKQNTCKKSIFVCETCKEPSKEKVEGNKADFLFPSFIPSKIAEKIEEIFNTKETVNLNTRLCKADSKRDVSYVVKKYYKKVGFEGNPYQLRKFGDRMILKRIELLKNDHNLKEFLMGHRVNDISFVYDIAGLNGETIQDWRRKYVECCDRWVCENIFGEATDSEIGQAEILCDMATSLGVNQEYATLALNQLKEGRISMSMFRSRVRTMIDKAYESKLEEKFTKWLSEKLPKALENLNNNH